jgi:glycerate kinase
VGELIAAAATAGADRVLLGVGGSASTDGGAGAVDALTAAGCRIGADLDVTVCCDVQTVFTSSAAVFGPQKGATAEQVRELTLRLQGMRDRIEATYGMDLDAMPGSGAAGGLAGGLAATGARLVRGFDAIAAHLGLDAHISWADLVVTGEGSVDPSSVEGKVVGGVLARARTAGKPLLVVCGVAEVDLGVPMVDLTASFGADRSWREPAECIRIAVLAHLGR